MAYRSGSVVTAGDGSGTSLSGASAVPRPIGAATDDILVLILYFESDVNLTISISPGTWTEETNCHAVQTNTTPDIRTYVFWSRQSASDSGTIAVTWGGANIWRTAMAAAYTGRLLSGDALDGTGTNNVATVSGTTATCTGMTTQHDNADVLAAAHNISSSLHTWTGVTERADIGGQSYGDTVQASAGSTGNKTASITSNFWAAELFALEADSGAAATPTLHPQAFSPMPIFHR